MRVWPTSEASNTSNSRATGETRGRGGGLKTLLCTLQLRKKTDGPGKMASGHQDELRGFGFRMSASELRRVNAWRVLRKRTPLASSPGLQFLQYGKNKDGYWDAEMFGKQIDRILDCFDCLHSDWQLCLEVHLHSSNTCAVGVGWVWWGGLLTAHIRVKG